MSYLAVLVIYAAVLVAVGVYFSRRVTSARDFFVAGRSLPSGLIFATFLAANIGAGSTVGATGRGFAQGLSAFWWVGSAAIGSFVLAFVIGPRIYRVAQAHNLLTVGDYLEMRYDRRVRLCLGATLWLGSLFILAGQLIAIAWILNVTGGVPKPVGCALGGVVIAAYCSTGGLRTSAMLHVIQITVKMVGFVVAVPWALHAIGGWSALTAAPDVPPGYFSPVGIGVTGVLGYLVVFAPNFFISPGLIQKLYGAKDEAAVRAGVGWHAVVMLLYALLPALLGMIARQAFPHLANPELALPTVLRDLLPWWLGALLLGAVFSAELSAGDAVLFMLSTSLGKDLYRGVINPAATEDQLLRVTRWASVGAGLLATLFAILLPDVESALKAFYGLLAVVLLAPFVAGLYSHRPTAAAALTSMASSVVVTLGVHVATGGQGYGVLNPVALGILAGSAVMVGQRVLAGQHH